MFSLLFSSSWKCRNADEGIRLFSSSTMTKDVVYSSSMTLRNETRREKKKKKEKTATTVRLAERTNGRKKEDETFFSSSSKKKCWWWRTFFLIKISQNEEKSFCWTINDQITDENKRKWRMFYLVPNFFESSKLRSAALPLFCWAIETNKWMKREKIKDSFCVLIEEENVHWKV